MSPSVMLAASGVFPAEIPSSVAHLVQHLQAADLLESQFLIQ